MCVYVRVCAYLQLRYVPTKMFVNVVHPSHSFAYRAIVFNVRLRFQNLYENAAHTRPFRKNEFPMSVFQEIEDMCCTHTHTYTKCFSRPEKLA